MTDFIQPGFLGMDVYAPRGRVCRVVSESVNEIALFRTTSLRTETNKISSGD